VRPSHRVNNRPGLLHVPIFTDGSEQVRDFQKLLARIPVMRSTISGV